MSTITEIAKELGLAKSTVSRALRGLPNIAPETLTAIHETAERLNYVPSVVASGLSIGRNHAIGVLAPSVNRWFYTSVLTGIGRALAPQGYDVVLFDLDRRPSELDRAFKGAILRHRVDALVVIATELDDPELAELARLEIPTLGVGPPAPGLRTIGVDDVAVMAMATEHVIALGHRSLAFVGGHDSESLTTVGAALRGQSFLATTAAAGIPVPEEWMLPGGYVMGRARKVVASVVRSATRPTALVCASDEMAIGAMYAVLDAGLRVPEDISVIGIDGHHNAEAFDLTTVQQDVQAQGASAATQLMAEVEGAERAESLDSPEFSLVVRGSTAPPSSV
jgi:LacI family repressor for deo operon, udp, cdd, tsx, nupC, and nupG